MSVWCIHVLCSRTGRRTWTWGDYDKAVEALNAVLDEARTNPDYGEVRSYGISEVDWPWQREDGSFAR